MAARRVCLRVSGGQAVPSSGARSSVRQFSTQRRPAFSATPAPTITATTTLQQSPRMPTTRPFSTSPARHHGHLDPPKPGEELTITFLDQSSHAHSFTVAAGDNLLDIAQAHDLEMEGACGGSCACSTCHVIVEDEAYYEKMDEPDDDENDMLDLAFGLTETSRLGCQVKMTRGLDGVVVRLPSVTRNLQASDFKEK